MDVTIITTFLTMMVAISVAAERMVEILKGWFPNLYPFASKPNATQEMRRCAFVHLLAGICGALVACFGKINVFAGLSTAPTDPWIHYVGAGLLASGGSAFWNQLLDLVQAAKVKREQAAIDAVDTNQHRNLVNPAHPASFALAMAVPDTLAAQVSDGLAAAATCVIRVNPGNGDFLAPKGILGFKINVIKAPFYFVPTGCSAKDPAGQNITFTQITEGLIVFPANVAGTYALKVQYLSVAGSKAQLLENCTSGMILDLLDHNVGDGANYTIQVS
jgi:hypothetical protein